MLRCWKSPPLLALLASAALFLVLALFGARYHWVEEAGTAERDGYVSQAEELLRGKLPRDPYRPLLYPLLTAAFTSVAGDPFAVARTLSNLAAAALAWLAFAFGQRLGGAAVGGWAMALTAVNPNLWIIGQHVTTDLCFAAFAAASLLAGLSYMEGEGSAVSAASRPLGAAVVAGATFGLAAFTRSNAWFLLPGLFLAWWWAPGSRRRRLLHLAAALGVALLVLAPHWALRYRVFGDPFYSEAWKNLAWKLYGFPDWSYLERVPFAGVWEVIQHDPVAVVRGGLRELGRFFHSGLAQLLGTWVHVVLFVAGSVVAVHRWGRRGAYLLWSGGAFLALTAASFFTWGRLLLVLLPFANALAASTWRASGPAQPALQSRAPATSWKRPVRLLGAVSMVLLLATKTVVFRLPAFVDRHPYVEVATARYLAAGLPPGRVLAGTSPFLGRYLERRDRYLYIPDAFGAEVESPELYFRHLAPLLRDHGVVYLVAGEVDLRSRPRVLVGQGEAVEWLSPHALGRGVWVWRVRGDRLGEAGG